MNAAIDAPTELDVLFGLGGRIAVVTGGSGALGSAIAHGLGAAGAAVALLARRAEPLERRTEALRADGIDALAVAADVLSADQLHAARDRIVTRWGRVDVLVNAAGGNVDAAIVGDDGDFADLPETAFRRVVDLNLLGTSRSCTSGTCAAVPSGSSRPSTTRGPPTCSPACAPTARSASPARCAPTTTPRSRATTPRFLATRRSAAYTRSATSKGYSRPRTQSQIMADQFGVATFGEALAVLHPHAAASVTIPSGKILLMLRAPP